MCRNARAMYMEVQVPREAGEGETAQQSRGWPGPCRERPMYMEEVRQGTCREAGLGHAGNGQRDNPGLWNQSVGDCRVTAFLAMTAL
jgi:hypothetical protein